MTDHDKQILIGDIVDHLGKAQKSHQIEQAALFYKAHKGYGSKIARGLGLNIKEIRDWPL